MGGSPSPCGSHMGSAYTSARVTPFNRSLPPTSALLISNEIVSGYSRGIRAQEWDLATVSVTGCLVLSLLFQGLDSMSEASSIVEGFWVLLG